MPRRLFPLAAFLTLVLALAAPRTASAQERAPLGIGGGVGATYYCIVSRCDVGATFLGLATAGLTPSLSVEASVRWHDCFDCSRFWIGEATLKLGFPEGTVRPFVGVGGGIASDPDFMGRKAGVHAALGSWIWPGPRWGFQLEVRGRTVGRGDAMGEASIAVARRL